VEEILTEFDLAVRVRQIGRGHAGTAARVVQGPSIRLAFPLSVWLRDSGGRWHAARSDRRPRGGRENTIRLQLVPPLTRPTGRAEIIVAGQSAEVRTTLPLRWEHPP
jgi:hypothetical protein